MLRAAVFFGGAAIAFCLLFVLFWMAFLRRRRSRGPHTRSPEDVARQQRCVALRELSPKACQVSFSDGLWTADVETAAGAKLLYTSHHRGHYRYLWEHDPSWFFRLPNGQTAKSPPSVQGWLNDRRDEYIHSIERPAAERRQIVNKPLETDR